MRGRPVDAPPPLPRGFRFLINESYDDNELSDLFEVLETRGASYAHHGPAEPGCFTVLIPSDLRWIPFFKTVRDCPSVKSVQGMKQETIIYQCEPEG